MKLGGRRFLLSLAIIGAAVCLALGITLPIIKLTQFAFWSTEHSLLSTVQVLINDGQTFLGLTVLIFSIVLPVMKLLYLLLVSTLPVTELTRQSRRLRGLEWLGKWSMHDVLVLSLTIFFIKNQGVYDAASLKGVYFFTAAVVLMIISYSWLRTEGLANMPELQADNGVVWPLTPFRNFVLSLLIICATVFFVLGIILPVIKFTTVYVWTNTHSIATIIYALFENEEYFLTVVLFLFSILFPFLKLLYLLTLMTSPDIPPEFRKKSIATMEWLGRYSMTDVMVLALMIFYVNSSGYTEAQVQPGVYFFALSALMTMLAYGWANSVPARSRQAAGPAGDAAPMMPPAPRKGAATLGVAAEGSDSSNASGGQLITLPTNPARRPPKPTT
jgi:paraquat-inducible protein A